MKARGFVSIDMHDHYSSHAYFNGMCMVDFHHANQVNGIKITQDRVYSLFVRPMKQVSYGVKITALIFIIIVTLLKPLIFLNTNREEFGDRNAMIIWK